MPYPAPTRTRKCTYSHVYRLPIEKYSQHVADHLIPYAQQRRTTTAGTVDIPMIVSTCAFSPKFFYDSIRKAWPALIAGGQLPPSCDGELDRFEERLKVGKTKPDEADEEFKRVGDLFSRAARCVFPHFSALQNFDHDVVRICTFQRQIGEFGRGRDDPSEYFTAFANFHETPGSTYAFFRWLNGRNKCRVALPAQWRSLGLHEGPRDFAVFNGEMLVEYHKDEEIYIQCEPSGKGRQGKWGNWMFSDVDMFLSCRCWDAQTSTLSLLSPEEFLERAFYSLADLQQAIYRLCDRRLAAVRASGREEQIKEDTARAVRLAHTRAEMASDREALGRLHAILADDVAFERCLNEWCRRLSSVQ